MKFLPLCVLVMGVESAMKGNIIVYIISLVLGVIIGELLDLDGKLNDFANFIKKFISGEEDKFAEGFISARLIFCVGSMTILGSIDAGLKGDNKILFAKATMDAFTAFFLATTFGKGVSLSALPIFIYHGILVFISGFLAPILSPEIAANLSGTGGIMIIAICLSMLKLVDYKIANSLPAIFVQ